MRIVRIAPGTPDIEDPKAIGAEAIGGKAAGLAIMARLGLPVPPAFVLPVDLTAAVTAGERSAKHKIADGLDEGIAFLEEATGRRFGDRRDPLLVSVRSGAAKSMPGMLDTVLDVGATPDGVRGLIRRSGNPRFAWDCRRRFLESFATVVLGLPKALFADALQRAVATEVADSDQGLDCVALEALSETYRRIVLGQDEMLPDGPMAELIAAATAVYRSWMSERAVTYRRLQHLTELRGTAVTVQAMVFGNGSRQSGAGVAFSRDPSSGRAKPVIDVLFGAQGEDVVSGDRTPDDEAALAAHLPDVAQALRETLVRLEQAFGDVMDVEFTIEDGRLWILQTRAAKRTPLAALRLAIDFVHEGIISKAQALDRLRTIDLGALTRTRLAEAGSAIGAGTPASTGIAVGRAAFDVESARQMAAGGEAVILLRPDTSTADVAGFAAAAGIVTAVGGRTAHAALVARQLGKPCIVGCAALDFKADGRSARIGETPIAKGDWLSLDGDAGTLHAGRGRIVTERPEAELAEVAGWQG